jgi:hypothetical protein
VPPKVDFAHMQLTVAGSGGLWLMRLLATGPQ